MSYQGMIQAINSIQETGVIQKPVEPLERRLEGVNMVLKICLSTLDKKETPNELIEYLLKVMKDVIISNLAMHGDFSAARNYASLLHYELLPSVYEPCMEKHLTIN